MRAQFNVEKLLSNNSGLSIKSALIFYVLILSGLIILSVLAVMIIDVSIDGKIDSAISFDNIFLSVGGLIASSGIPKIVGEIQEYKTKNKSENENS